MQSTTNRLGELMDASQVKRIEIAALCDRDTTTVGRWISGEVPIPDDAKRLLVARFNCTVEHLMGWDRQPAEPKAAA